MSLLDTMNEKTQILTHLNELRALLPALRAGEISAIEFGEEGAPLGFMSHHRIQYIATMGGFQLALKPVHRGSLGSGEYIGDPDDRTIEIYAQNMVEHYLRPTPLRARLIQLRKETGTKPAVMKYFAITGED